MPINYHQLRQAMSSLPSPLSEDFAVVLGLKESEIEANRLVVSQLGTKERCHNAMSMLSRLREENQIQQETVYSRFTSIYLLPLLAKWRESDTESDSYLMFFMMLNAIHDNQYFQTYLSLNPGAGLEILRHHAETLASASWSSARDEIAIFHACQFLANMLVFEDAEGTISPSLVPRLVVKLESWDGLFSNFPVSDDNLKNPRNPIGRAIGLVKREPEWILMAQPAKVRMQRKMRSCNFPFCNVPYVPGTNSLRQCSKCKTARYCSPEHQSSHWRQHKHVCYAPVWI